MTNILVCIKIVIDPEIPLSLFKIDQESNRPIQPGGTPPVFSPFDLNALEAALKVKDQNKENCEVTIISLGKNIPKALIQKLLAMGADNAVTLDDSVFDNLNPYSTVQCLSSGIKKLGNFDLIFTGRSAADWEASFVWAGVAQTLEIPAVTIARKVTVDDQKATVERCVSDGIETLSVDMPALITFSSEVGEPRFAPLKAMIAAKKKGITRWSAGDIGFKPSEAKYEYSLSEATFEKIDCQFLEGSTDTEKGQILARMIQSSKI